jgi:hypothetical protein
MSFFTATAFYQQVVAGVTGATVQVRADPSGSFVYLAVPGTQFSDLNMANYYSDISSLIRGSGNNILLSATGSVSPNLISSTGSVLISGSYNWSVSGSYTTSIFQEDSGSLGLVSNSELNFNSSSFVVETWMNLTERLYSPGAPFHKTILSYSGASGYGAGLSFPSTGPNSPLMRMRMLFKTGNQYFSGNFATSLSTWYYYAWVRTGNNLNFYLNNNRIAGPTALAAGDQSATTATSRILGYSDLNEGAKGVVQDLRISIGTDRGYTNATITLPQSIVQKI